MRSLIPELRTAAAFALAVSTASACGKPQIVPRAAPGVEVASITVTSPSFSDGAAIPVDFTCDGSDLIPELVLSSPPENTKSLVIVVEDPDAASGTFVHMIAFNVSPTLRKLPSGTELTGAGDAARFGLNDFRVAHYSGPCPPKGEAHRYRFRVVAIDTVLNLPEGTPRRQIDEATDGHILGEGILTGYFGH
jgi:Raf kinase inhibitor-like YbhB/YbcL family protein